MSVAEIESAGITWSSPCFANQWTGAKPAGIADGDVMTCAILVTDEARTVNTVPAGWVEQANALTGNGRILLYTKAVTNAAGEPSTWQWILDADATNEVYGCLTLWRGVDQDSPVGAVRWVGTASDTDHAGPDIAPEIIDGELAAWFFVATGTAATWTPPAGMTEQFDSHVNLASGMAVELATLTLTDEGQTGVKTATATQAGVGAVLAATMRPHSPLEAPVRVAGVARTDLGSAAAEIAVTRPEVKVGQLMYAAIGTYSTNGNSEGAITETPTGWTLIALRDGTYTGGPTLHLKIYVKTAGLNEPKSYTWKTEGNSQSSGVILAFEGAAYNDVASVVRTTTAQLTSLVLPAVTPAKRHSLLVAAWYVENAPALPAFEKQQSSGAGVATLVVATTPKAAASDSGTHTATFALSAGGAAMIAFAPKIPIPKSLQEAA